MKRLALAAAVMLFAACSSQEEAVPADTMATPPAMAPAPVTDSAAMPMDSTAMDTTATDTTVTPPPAGQ